MQAAVWHAAESAAFDPHERSSPPGGLRFVRGRLFSARCCRRAASVQRRGDGHWTPAGDVLDSCSFAEGNAAAYWDATDLYERANARLFKEIEFALPLERPDERHELAESFAEE
jgi:hypothetical protein